MELLTTVVYQTVTNRPRTWSSHTNVNSKDERHFGKSMNSVEELSTYDLSYAHRNPYKTAATTYDFPDHAPSAKKDRKWSFGNLFRRKKKDESETSSDDELHKKNFLNRKKNKGDKRKKPVKSISTVFDHIVSPPSSQNTGRLSHVLQKSASLHRSVAAAAAFEDAGILSDPSGYFDSYAGRPLPRPPHNEVLHSVGKQQEKNRSHNSLGSADSLSKKSRKERTKARAVARRDSINHRSSSDEDDSQRSCSSSRFRSDESLTKHRDGSVTSRRSRTARTERYIRRLSKDDESILNREAMQRQARENWQLLNIRDDYTSGVCYSQSPNVLKQAKYGYRQPPNAVSNSTYNNNNPVMSGDSMQNSGLFTIPPSHSNHKYRNSNSHMQISQPYDDVHTSRLSVNQQQSTQLSNQNSNSAACFNMRSLSCDSNIHKSPSPEEIRNTDPDNYRYRNLCLMDQNRLKQPPPPPPRDPRRMICHPNNHSVDIVAPQWYPIKQAYRRSQFAGYRTASEDVIPTFSEKSMDLEMRPASVTNEIRKQGLNSLTRMPLQDSEKFKYMTEKRPRSRKPIFIQSTDRINSNHFNSSMPKTQQNSSSPPYWKPPPVTTTESRTSPVMFTAQTHVQSKIFLPSTVVNNTQRIHVFENTTGEIERQNSPFKPITLPTNNFTVRTTPIEKDEEEPSEELKRKSANLEEALDELEAIYKSLHLGDEDLLERAEQRELSIATKKMLESHDETYSGISRGAISDSSFSYEPFNALDAPKKKVLKKARTLDRKTDDMAFRKMNMEGGKPTKSNSSFNSLANVSYLLASPVHFESSSPKSDIDECDGNSEANKSNEPDVTLDDVVYRIVKHANNRLKVIDPQPPFGIPIGPVPPSSNSDYLHAVPENITNYPPYIKNKIPDIVKDDLAFRNLRKDSNKEPALKPVTPTDFDNVIVGKESKKKRAVRSLSANISNLINQEQYRLNTPRKIEGENEFKKTNLTDIADAMEIARQILREKENRIQATRRAFLSDSETKYRRDGMSASSTETITESRLNFLNEMRSADNLEQQSDNQSNGSKLLDGFLQAKPPRGATPDRRLGMKETTPTPSSPGEQSRKESRHSSFEELLTALAVEARETSDRITSELNTLEDSLKRKESSAQKQMKEIDAVSEHAKLCEKLLECVVESTELIASTKVESNAAEHVESIDTQMPETIANIVTTRSDGEEEVLNPVEVEVHSTSEQDYDNLIASDLDVDLKCEESCSKSPFEEHRADLIARFQEMKSAGDAEASGMFDNVEADIEVDTTSEGGEQCAERVMDVANFNTHVATALPANVAFVSEFSITSMPHDEQQQVLQHHHSFTSNCDIFIDDYSLDGDDTNDDGGITRDDDLDSLRSSGFHSNTSESTKSIVSTIEQIPDNLLASLESPKLVTSAMKMTEIEAPSTSSSTEFNSVHQPSIRNCKAITDANTNMSTDCKPIQRYSSAHASGANRSANRFPPRGNRGCNDENAKTKSRTWYGDPIMLAFACSYGVACSYQLATLDVVTILGIIFVVISLAAAFLLE